LSGYDKSKLVASKLSLRENGIDTKYFDSAVRLHAWGYTGKRPAPPNILFPARRARLKRRARSNQTFKLLLGRLSAVGNFFIVLFMGVAFAAAAHERLRKGLLFRLRRGTAPHANIIVDRKSAETLERDDRADESPFSPSSS